jgi:signal transduction histidine kinase
LVACKVEEVHAIVNEKSGPVHNRLRIAAATATYPIWIESVAQPHPTVAKPPLWMQFGVYASKSAPVEVSAGLVIENGRHFVRLTVADDGPGIPVDVLPRLFNSFVTTKSSGKGTGMGLRICRRIVEEMDGRLAAANRPQGGAEFEILLPALEAQAAAA